MKPMLAPVNRGSLSPCVFRGTSSMFALASLALSGSASGEKRPSSREDVVLVDPRGDDDGPGTYTYPTDPVYTKGSFDILEFRVRPRANVVEFAVTVNATIEDPWKSPSWDGNGFSVQMIFVHIDMDHESGSGITRGIPGTNGRFTPEEAWDKVIVISPQGSRRLWAEIDRKASVWKDRIIVPRTTRASDRTLVAVVDAASLGGPPQPQWGYQVVMQSNEGFPEDTDLLTRRVNQHASQHRFGGGTGSGEDPQVVDILVPAGGDARRKQHEILSRHPEAGHAASTDRFVVVPMVYPERNRETSRTRRAR
jgi:carbohydrate-binding DOMON domain-containing protein